MPRKEGFRRCLLPVLLLLPLWVTGQHTAHLARSGSSFKYFWKSLRECEVTVFHCHPESGL